MTNCDTCKFDISEDDYDMCEPMVEGECKYEPQTMYYPQVDGITPTVITEDRDTQILDAWQVKLKAEQTEPQTIVIVKDHGRKQALEMINLYHKLKTEQTEREGE